MILVRSRRETSTGYKHCYPGQRFFGVPYKDGTLSLSHLVLNVLSVGHSAEA
jgi:hypothetical protein